jgi:hypothetical protein
MPYGTIKVDNIVFTNAGVDQTIGVSGLVQSISGNLTVTGTISGNIIRGNTVSGATITGGVLNAVSGVFAPGTSGTPSISFTSDSNTGFWSPAGDTVAISTGGSERIRVDSDGDLGIGTTSPTSRLTVRADAATGPNTIIRVENRSVSAGATTQNIRIEGILDYNNGTSDASAGAIVFGKDGTYTTSTANIDSYLALETVLNNTSTERFRITSSGNVGIGTTSPGAKLHVVSETAGNPTLGTGSGGLFLSSDNGWYGLYAGINGSTGNTWLQAMRNDAATAYDILLNPVGGRVGIGTTGPSHQLDVVSASTSVAEFSGPANATVEFKGSGFVEGKIQCGGELIVGSTNNYPVAFVANNTERARLTSDGKLLVGTSSARSIGTQSWGIQQEGTTFTNTGVSTVRNSADAFGSYFVFGKSRGTAVGANTIVANGDELGRILFSGADGTDVDSFASWISCEVDGTPGANDMPGRLVFSTTTDGAASPTERMRITSAGNVGIGTSSPSTTLDVSGTLRVTGAATLAGGGTSTTSAVDTNSTAIATTAFVVGQAGAATPLINGTATVGTSLRYSRQDHIHPTDTTRAALASPTFTGTPAAPTAALGTNTTQIATTAYVKTEISNSTAANVSGTVAIANGGTGQTTAANAINALVPSQASNSGKVLGTNGSVVSWVAGNAGDAQPFNSSGTWTKPNSGTFALIRCWGGGGSGAREGSSGGGGGGGCMERLMLLSDLASTVTVTIGAGGTAISGSNANGNAGGDTTFGSHVTGTGGQGGTTAGIGGAGGGGLGTLFAGATSSALSGSSSGAYGGGSGGTEIDTGGNSSYGGAGGGGRRDSTVRAGGTSEYGGAGGAGGGNGAGVAGSVPGGGGGASSTTSGAGAAGRCIVYVF